MKCRKCKNFFITHDPRTPYGCRAFQIKSQRMPEMAVKEANSGSECMGFTPKPEAKPKTKNLNDSKYW